VRTRGGPALPGLPDKTYAFERARSFAVYEGALVQAILLLKYEQNRALGRVWRTAGGSREGARQRLAADVVVPVRSSPAGNARRGYNQRRLLSKNRWPRRSDYA